MGQKQTWALLILFPQMARCSAMRSMVHTRPPAVSPSGSASAFQWRSHHLWGGLGPMSEPESGSQKHIPVTVASSQCLNKSINTRVWPPNMASLQWASCAPELPLRRQMLSQVGMPVWQFPLPGPAPSHSHSQAYSPVNILHFELPWHLLPKKPNCDTQQMHKRFVLLDNGNNHHCHKSR